MKLIKLPQDHYIIVDDSSLKEGDYVLSKLNEVEVFGRRYTPSLYRKITHSTQPLEQYYGATDGTIPFVYHKIIELPLSEVKELIGEVDVEMLGYNRAVERKWGPNSSETKRVANEIIEAVKFGYNQALEDNKDKRFSEEDLWKAMGFGYDMCRQKRLDKWGFENFIKSLQPKTEWEVEFIDGKLKLVQ